MDPLGWLYVAGLGVGVLHRGLVLRGQLALSCLGVIVNRDAPVVGPALAERLASRQGGDRGDLLLVVATEAGLDRWGPGAAAR